jgi:cysteine desulfurase family protein (TIGR01976 family)
MSFSPDAVRPRFPGLSTDWALLDNAGGSQILGTSLDRLREAYLTSYVQPGGSYAASALAAERTEAATRAWAACLNAADPREIVFGASTTQLLQNLSRAMEPSIQAGDEIVVCEADHESNIGPWVRLAAARGATLRWWRPHPETFELSLDELSLLLTPKTKLLAFGQVSNLLGHVNPAKEAVRRAHEVGAKVVVDGVAFAPHRRVDVRALGADCYVLSLYKVYGPRISLLYGKLDLLQALAPINHFFLPADKLPHKLAPGGLNFELAHAAGAVPEYLASLDFEGVAAHESALAERLLSFLRGRVRIIGRPKGGPERLPTVSFVLPGRDASEIPPRLDVHRVGLKSGDFYARRLCDSLGLTARGGVIRASFVHYNTIEEADRLISALDEAITRTEGR